MARYCVCENHDGSEPWHGKTSGYKYHRCKCESCKEFGRQLYQDRKDYVAQWGKENPERLKDLNSRWVEANRDKVRAASKRFEERHPERVRANYLAQNRRRRAIKHATGYEPYVDNDIFTRDNWICQLCDRPIDPELPRTNYWGATIDHVIPISKGGPDAPDNVQSAHWICNVRKNNRTETVEVLT